MSKNFTKKLIGLKKRLRTLLGKRYYCSVCNNKIGAFIPLPDSYRVNALKYKYQYFGQNEHLNITKYSCPNCGSNDRDRLYASYFKNFQKPIDKNKKLLHVAPSWPLNNRFLINNYEITTTDIIMDNVDYKMDIENMVEFEDSFFDFFICSHVLEHVLNPDQALRELYRVLKPGGYGIIMAPIIPNLKDTLENKNHISKAERIQYYGQEDHLRLFSKEDFIKRIKNADFEVIQLGIKEFGKPLFKSLGIRESSILYIGHKLR